MQPEQHVAIITGSSRGIGKRIAQVLAGEGLAVVLTARDRPAAAGGSAFAETAREIRAAGGEVLAHACDVADEAEVRSLVAAAIGQYGRVDLLVNNAATRLSTRLLDTTSAELEHIFRVNVLGPFHLWRAVLPTMIERGSGNVINLISTNAPVQPFIGMAHYRMTKAALTFLSVDLAQEVRDAGIAVNAFDPGPVVSDGTAAIRAQRERRYNLGIPYHALDSVEVVDASIAWLARQTVATFTGQVVRRIDFGRTWGPGLTPAGASAAPRTNDTEERA